MNAFKTLVLSKTMAAAAVVAGGLAAPAISHASPDDGMICRVGYAAQFAGNNMKCTKLIQRTATLQCLSTRFPNKVIRATVPGDSTAGRDLCTRPGVVIGSNDPLTGLVQNQDFVFAQLNPSQPVAVREAAERGEEAALNLPADQVDAQVSQPSIVINGGLGSEDNARFTVTLFTFAIPAPSLTLPTLPSLPVNLVTPRLP